LELDDDTTRSMSLLPPAAEEAMISTGFSGRQLWAHAALMAAQASTRNRGYHCMA